MAFDGDQLPLCLLSALVGIFFSQWYLHATTPIDVENGTGSMLLSKYSNLVHIRLGHNCAKPCSPGTTVGTINLEESSEGVQIQNYNEKCISVVWKPTTAENNGMHFHSEPTVSKFRHSFSVGSGSWYGGPQLYTARWPIDKENVPIQRYLSDDIMARPEKLGSILERYWLSSTNFALYILDDDANFQYGIEDGDIILQSPVKLSYVVCTSQTSVKDTHLYMAENFIGKPSGLPDRTMFTYPIWSTWARYKVYINESKVVEFSEEVKKNGFPASQIEIDDTYTTNYGDHVFDPERFPDPKRMVSRLKESGFRVTSWVHPFVNIDSASFQDGSSRGYFLSTRKHAVPGLIRWWQGTAAMINVTDEQAVRWFVEKLERLRGFGIDSFKFDGGEAVYMPDGMIDNPNRVTQRYVEVVSRFGGMIETRAAYRNQGSPTFLRMMDKHSYWGFDNGLRSMIPSALHLSIIGYHFVLPDMIGGNAMGPDDDWYSGEIPEKELYIRWFQLVTFLQSMQISIAPWQYDEETTEIARDLVKLHADYVAPRVISLAEQAVSTGAPIVRPVWWVALDDPAAYQIEDQFLIGDDLLVAPVVEKGVRSRSVYIPAGSWTDVRTLEVYHGPVWIAYHVNLKTVPYFERNQGKIK